MKKRYTYHEAGHAVTALLLGVPFEEVSMTPRRERLRTTEGYRDVTVIGLVFPTACCDAMNEPMRQGIISPAWCVMAMAGHKAEEMVLGGTDDETTTHAAAHCDPIHHTCLCSSASEPCFMARQIIKAFEDQAETILRRHSDAVAAVADTLNERKVLRREAVSKILAECSARQSGCMAPGTAPRIG